MSNIINIEDSLTQEHLAVMRFVAQMKESADKQGVGFIGGFVAPDGKKFMMTNMSDEDTNLLLPDELK